MLAGAWRAFPVYDDAYLYEFLRELGPAGIARDHPDRPVYGLLMQWITTVVGISRFAYLAIGFGFWALLAWETTRLWKKVFPENSELAPVGAFLVLAPVVVEIQLTTLTTVIPVHLPVCLSLGALLLCLREREGGRPLLAAVGLVFLGGLVSEYATVAVAAGAAFLIVQRRVRTAAALASTSILAEVVRRLFAESSLREDTAPAPLLTTALREPLGLLTRWFTGMWQTCAGAWLTAGGSIRIEQGNRWTLVAVPAALLAALIAAVWLRSIRPFRAHEPEIEDRSIAGLLAATAAGLVPVVLALRSAAQPAYQSRFRLPVLPYAVLVFIAVILRVMPPRQRPLAFAFVLFVAEYAAVDQSAAAVRQQRLLERVGAQLLPLVHESSGFAVAVLPGQRELDGADLTPKATRSWTTADARRAWVMSPNEALELFGPRTACRDTRRLDLPPRLHFTPRHGAISHLTWIPVEEGDLGAPETYCVAPVRAGGMPLAGRAAFGAVRAEK